MVLVTKLEGSLAAGTIDISGQKISWSAVRFGAKWVVTLDGHGGIRPVDRDAIISQIAAQEKLWQGSIEVLSPRRPETAAVCQR